MATFEVGQKVKILNTLKRGFGYKTYASSGMEERKGQVATVTEVIICTGGTTTYCLSGDNEPWRWTSDMIQPHKLHNKRRPA